MITILAALGGLIIGAIVSGIWMARRKDAEHLQRLLNNCAAVSARAEYRKLTSTDPRQAPFTPPSVPWHHVLDMPDLDKQ